jgi:hypothetical protein
MAMLLIILATVDPLHWDLGLCRLVRPCCVAEEFVTKVLELLRWKGLC